MRGDDPRLLFWFELFHDALDEFFGVRKLLHDDLNVHHGLAGPAQTLAIHPMLADQGHSISDAVEGHRETAARYTHHRFEMLEFFLLFLEYRHASIVT